MRITYIHQHFSLPTEPGGQRPWEFARRLVRAGHEVSVLCGGQVDSDRTVEGVRVIRLRAPYDNAMSPVHRIKSFLEFMARATAKAIGLQADLVFASSTPLTAAIPGMAGALAQKAPFIFEVRDLWPSVPIELGILKNRPLILAARLLEKIAYSQAAHIIALSPGMADGVRAVAPNAGVTIVPNASDVSLFGEGRRNRRETRESLGWGSDEVVLVYAGSFGVTYDVPWLVELAGELGKRSRKYRVVICGKGADTERLKRRAVELGLNPDSLLPGPLPKTEIVRLLPAADFAVSTMIDAKALEVNSLNKVFDALAAGTPVIFNHRGWLPELLSRAGAGVQLSRNPIEAAGELHIMISRGLDRHELASNALELGTQRFDREKLFQAFLGVLQTALDARLVTRV